MSKNIVILLDGTANQISAKRTNILRLYGCLHQDDRQTVYYDPGVGTLGAADSGFHLTQKASEVWGMATARGMDRNIKEAYEFLVHNCARPDKDGQGGDNIYIFGFSRGAYSARVLAGFIHALGLIEPRHLNLLDYAYRGFKRISIKEEADRVEDFTHYDRILQPRRTSVRLLGLFDTVSSVFEFNDLERWLISHAYTDKNPSVQCIRQALAMDEKRTMFRGRVWPEGNDFYPSDAGPARLQDAKDVWFPGVHGDVGGGYDKSESGLAKIALHWMIEETRHTGLLYDDKVVDEIVLGKPTEGPKSRGGPDPFAKAHNSMTPGWGVLEFLPRRSPALSRRSGLVAGWQFPLFEPRFPAEGSRIHQSVLDRIAKGWDEPVNLPERYVTEPWSDGFDPNA